jgi:ribonucleoside-triphosphate reductase
VGYTSDPFQALEEQEELQKKYTGGTVLHLYMGERVSSAEACKQLVKRSLENFRLPYITVTPTFSICPKHGYIAGEHAYCPICDEELAAAKKARQANRG